ncbi:two-component system, NarL family, sensor histidine kinase UhpB [Fulvimarina manganoxydans]|uniref:Two-component system, NarL family, sensor histidine kinase UhpB n=1 Tax=Fulvimarina manganoxydans TaxID=937218 RepID=A0A1W2CIE9_9HYPH|nr:histidine kinase [Fulvimarina manganoxydans]SMC84993.1 two-component system, NarL family, sensor histidine kinase UhpB [Fulvimarina manganoxydans]
MSSDARDGGSAKPGRFDCFSAGRLSQIGRAASDRLWRIVPPLALRTRLALTLSIAFLGILAIGGTLATEQARGSIAEELASSRTVATNRVAQLLAELPASRDIPGQLQGFVRAYNGDRDVQIMLIDSVGAVRDSSQPAEDYRGLPEWFVSLLAPRPATRIIPLSGLAAPITAVVVAIDPRNEIAETWGDLFYALGILVAFVLVTFAVIWIVVERALSPVEDIRSAFGRIGAGDTGAHVTPRGPPEMRALAEGLNQMVDRLAEASIANRRLSEQLQRLQDEERASLARDLHDDVGPLLFAIDVEAGAIARKLPADAAPMVSDRVAAIRSSALEARRAVRRILADLRPGVMPGLGLKAAVEDHVSTLAQRHPETEFKVDALDGSYPPPVEMTLFRAIREAVNNALKHGTPKRITIRLVLNEDDAEAGRALVFTVTDDGGGFARETSMGGMGIVGMRERLEAAGGALRIDQVPIPAGVRVEGRIPLHEDGIESPGGA